MAKPSKALALKSKVESASVEWSEHGVSESKVSSESKVGSPVVAVQWSESGVSASARGEK